MYFTHFGVRSRKNGISDESMEISRASPSLQMALASSTSTPLRSIASSFFFFFCSPCLTYHFHSLFFCCLFTDQRGVISPSVVEHTGHVTVAHDEGAVLLCIAQACPTPEYR